MALSSEVRACSLSLLALVSKDAGSLAFCICVKKEEGNKAGKLEVEKKQTVVLEVGQDRDCLTESKVIVHSLHEASKENQDHML